jgi:hypothetical protein
MECHSARSNVWTEEILAFDKANGVPLEQAYGWLDRSGIFTHDANNGRLCRCYCYGPLQPMIRDQGESMQHGIEKYEDNEAACAGWWTGNNEDKPTIKSSRQSTKIF